MGNSEGHFAVYAAIFGVMCLMCGGLRFGTADDGQITVKKTWTVRNGEGADSMMVEASTGRIFKVEDDIWTGSFRSTNVWANMEPGDVCRVQYHGLRIGILSWFPEIYDVSCKSPPEAKVEVPFSEIQVVQALDQG